MNLLERSWQSTPVTALHFVRHKERILLLAAKGSYVDVFEEGSSKAHIKVLESESVQGLAAISSSVYVAWGGQALRVFCLSVDDQGIRLRWLGQEVILDDWILSAAALTLVGDNEDLSHPEQVRRKALGILTAHNEVFSLSSTAVLWSDHGLSQDWSLSVCAKLAVGRPTMLYSGHIMALESAFLVASGTMFGQVLIWRIRVLVKENLARTLQYESIASFHEHEGSVFGVRLNIYTTGLTERPQIRVASCSDDRTLRVYEVHEQSKLEKELGSEFSDFRTGFGSTVKISAASTEIERTITTMGHSSRIWSVLWLEQTIGGYYLITFGEDAIAQTWKLAVSKPLTDVIQVVPIKTYGYHSGKNIWAADVISLDGDRQLITTGGADGRIVTYEIGSLPDETIPDTLRCTLSQFDLALLQPEAKQPVSDRQRNLFNGLQGTWSLERNLISRSPQYPSGTFSGQARLSGRLPTDADYDCELLYEEKGQFFTTTGPTFQARRNYVYRYRESTNTITVWFVKPEEQTMVDYLFHQVQFQNQTDQPRDREELQKPVLATGYHLCVDDHYNATYEFPAQAEALDSWSLSYHVTGPEKDYVAKSIFTSTIAKDHASRRKMTTTTRSRSKAREDCFRAYVWLSPIEVLMTTDHGRVVLAGIADTEIGTGVAGCVTKPTYRCLDELPELASYSLLCPLAGKGALVAGADGAVFLYDHRNISIVKIWKFDIKVAFMHAQRALPPNSNRYLVFLQLLKRPQIQLGYIDDESQQLRDDAKPKLHALELPDGFVTTSAAWVHAETLIVVGSREGALCVWTYDHDQGSYQRITTSDHSNLTGYDAITSIQCAPLPSKKDGHQVHAHSTFVTAGRDGMVKINEVMSANERSPAISTKLVHALQISPLPSVEGSNYLEPSNELVLWGFRGKDFIVWNYHKQQEIMRVECGNAHRSWAFTLHHSNSGGASFVWTQASSCYIHLQNQVSHQVLASGGHGREIKALTMNNDWNSSDPSVLIATGAEDTDIRLFSFRVDEGSSVPCIATLSRHKTGITQLRLLDRMLCSAGGREEFFVWTQVRPQLRDNNIHSDVLLKCSATCPIVTDDGDLRIMDFDVKTSEIVKSQYRGHHLSGSNGVEDHDLLKNEWYIFSMVYSDSSVRIWSYEYGNEAFRLLSKSSYTTACLTCARHISIGSWSCLLAASTDGHIALFSMPTRPDVPDMDACRLCFRHQIHQNAIKSLDVVVISATEVLIISGGDDNAVAFTRLVGEGLPPTAQEITFAKSAPANAASAHSRDPGLAQPKFKASTLIVPKAHAAAVNTVTVVHDLPAYDQRHPPSGVQQILLATTSSDQLVKLWVTVIDTDPASGTDGLQIKRKTAFQTEVADAAGLVSVRDRLIVAGVGMESVRLNVQDPWLKDLYGPNCLTPR